MMPFIMEFLKSMGPEPAAAAGGEAVTSAIPQAMASQAPTSLGQAAGDFATQSIGQQIQPAMNLYNQVTAPGATGGDMARSAFEYTIKSDADPQNQVKIPAMAAMNPYASMTNNTAGGIPSLLQNTQSGLLPFFGSR